MERHDRPDPRLITRMMGAEMKFDPAQERETRCEACSLSCVKAGVTVRIKQLCAAPEVQERLRDLGFCEDQIIRLVTSQTNFICQVCNARLAISEQLARLIMVEPVPATVSIR